MKTALSLVAATVLLFVSGAAMAAEGAFGPLKIGPQASFGAGNGSEDIGGSMIGIGVRGEFSLEEMSRQPVSVAISFDYFFADCQGGVDCTVFETNVNGLYVLPLKIPAMFEAYAGGGLSVLYEEVDSIHSSHNTTDLGLNILAGVRFDLDTIFTPYVETRFEFDAGSRFVFSGGMLF